MEADTILITGATGHLGFKVLVLVLEAGYNARVAVRTQSGIDNILATPSIKSLSTGTNLEFIIVPDILSPGAYNDAVKNVDFIIHCASPITSGIASDFDSKILQPAVLGTTGILHSALSSPSIRRIVITSSIVATIPVSAFSEQSTEIFDGQLQIPMQSPPYPSELHAYMDSKVRALKASKDFIREKKPAFDIINFMPSVFLGKNELSTLSNFLIGTNRYVMNQVLGTKVPRAVPGMTVHITDLAKLHVLALNPEIEGNQDFAVSSEGVDGVELGDALKIVARKFPSEVAEGILPNNGTQPTVRFKIDSSKTERVFGMKMEGFERQVVEVVGHYLELVKAAKSA
jgi:nucleoside-diphosphate-sugar epimerase